jgi:hypothetical protein
VIAKKTAANLPNFPVMNLQPTTLQKIDEVITHYPVKRSATLPLLHLIQEDLGWISPEAMEWIAAKLELTPINVYEVVTFYPMFRQKPIGRAQNFRNSLAASWGPYPPMAKSRSILSNVWPVVARAPW